MIRRVHGGERLSEKGARRLPEESVADISGLQIQKDRHQTLRALRVDNLATKFSALIPLTEALAHNPCSKYAPEGQVLCFIHCIAERRLCSILSKEFWTTGIRIRRWLETITYEKMTTSALRQTVDPVTLKFSSGLSDLYLGIPNIIGANLNRRVNSETDRDKGEVLLQLIINVGFIYANACVSSQ